MPRSADRLRPIIERQRNKLRWAAAKQMKNSFLFDRFRGVIEATYRVTFRNVLNRNPINKRSGDEAFINNDQTEVEGVKELHPIRAAHRLY
jgi:hypothetical protein